MLFLTGQILLYNQIILTMDNLPQLSGQYECVYTGYGAELQTSSERFSKDELTCVIPPKENVSQFTSISGRFIC